MTESTLSLDNAQRLAERCADVLYEQDLTAKQLGMTVREVTPGGAEVSMPVQPWMVNGHDTCHGGMIFTLADTAFAFACNSENYNTVAAGCSIDYINPGHRGDQLTATATKAHQRGRTGIYDVLVENQQGTLIAMFRGRSHRIKGSVIPATKA
ncbi:MAG: hydroxyphenylacetyl-CoA thioesterase PaaI [Halopseudomonas sp.]